MIDFLNNEKKMLLAFIRESKLLIGITLFFIILSYGIKLFYFDFSIDSEVILSDYDRQIESWLKNDRIGLVFTKYLLFHGVFNPYVANFLTYVMFTIVSLLICFLVQRILKIQTKNIAIMIIPILFLTHPIFAEQFNFILQSFEVSLAILFLGIALLLTYYYINTGFKIFAIVSILLCTWSFLTYQSLLLFFISGSIASFILILHHHEKENDVKNFKVYFTIGFKYFVVFLTAFILSQVLVVLHSKITGFQGSSYLSRQILWGTLPIEQIAKNILHHVYSVVLGKNIFYNYSFLISGSIIVLLLIRNMVWKNKSAFLEMIGFILLFISPFLLTIFMGQSEVFRAQMPAIQLVIAFSFYYIYLHLKNNWIKKLLVFLCVFIAFYQSNVTANLLFSEHVKYEEDVTFANRINVQLDSMGVGNRNQYSLILLGKHESEAVTTIVGETLGHSFFAWDMGTSQGTSIRAIGFMKTLGYPFNIPTSEQLTYAQSIENELTVWPDNNSIRIDEDVIIIKLSE